MNLEHLSLQEKINTGTSNTKNNFFDKTGYLIIRNLWDPKELYHKVPEERGQLTYWSRRLDQYTHNPLEEQVNGSLARYWHPQYREIHSKIRLKLEEQIGCKLYNTYYYDRFYFPGQELKKHADRDACEISVTVHISTNLKGKDAEWPIWIKTPDTYSDKKKTQIITRGENHSVVLHPGDGMVYKGCERPHWREPMPGKKMIRNWFKKEKIYYHQIFFHYVLADGQRAHCAGDKGR